MNKVITSFLFSVLCLSNASIVLATRRPSFTAPVFNSFDQMSKDAKCKALAKRFNALVTRLCVIGNLPSLETFEQLEQDALKLKADAAEFSTIANDIENFAEFSTTAKAIENFIDQDIASALFRARTQGIF